MERLRGGVKIALAVLTVLFCYAGLVAECHGAVKTHVVIGVGADYAAECNGMTVIPAGDVAGWSISVPDGFRILFSNGSAEQLPYVDQRFGYIKIYAGNEFRLTPMTGIKICSVRIYVKEDYSSGWKNLATALPIDRIGSRYEWRGESAYAVNLSVAGRSGDYQHVAYFEIDYAPIVETPPDSEDPSDEEDIKPVIISPQTSSPISPDQEISLSCESENTRIYYTTDGSEPGDRSPVYMHPFTLSPSTGLIVRAMAVMPRGQTATALRRYYLDRVESPEDFIINGCRNYETKIDCGLRIAYGKGEYGYIATADTDDDTQYLLVKFPRGYEIPRPNTMIENVKGVCDYMLDQDGMMMISAPTATDECPNPLIPVKKKISSIAERHLNLYISISDVTFTGEKFVDKEGYSILADDIFSVAGNDLKQKNLAEVEGFVGLKGDLLTLRPVKAVVDRSDSREAYLKTIAVGGGKIEVFDAINDYSLTPVGRPLDLALPLTASNCYYVYLIPDDGRELASLVVDGELLTPDDETLTDTPYGTLYEFKAKAGETTMIATFGLKSGVENLTDDSEKNAGRAEYFTLSGISLGYRVPEAKGLYLCRNGARVMKIAVK